MPLLEPVVLLDVVQVVPPDDARLVHLQLGDDTGQDPAADGHLADEGALLVDVVAHLGLGGDLAAQAGVAAEAGLARLQASLLVEEDRGLLLESSLVLISHGGGCFWNKTAFVSILVSIDEKGVSTCTVDVV